MKQNLKGSISFLGPFLVLRAASVRNHSKQITLDRADKRHLVQRIDYVDNGRAEKPNKKFEAVLILGKIGNFYPHLGC
jgi:hypothetical protein